MHAIVNKKLALGTPIIDISTIRTATAIQKKNNTQRLQLEIQHAPAMVKQSKSNRNLN